MTTLNINIQLQHIDGGEVERILERIIGEINSNRPLRISEHPKINQLFTTPMLAQVVPGNAMENENVVTINLKSA